MKMLALIRNERHGQGLDYRFVGEDNRELWKHLRALYFFHVGVLFIACNKQKMSLR